MNQRRPRLGDVLDDYCPRERRITNHAVVAMVEDDVKQTRCMTCDAEHEYKHAKVPASRKRKTETPTAHLVEGASKLPAETAEVHDDAHEPEMSGADLHTDESDPSVRLDADQSEGVSPEFEQHAELAAAPAAADGDAEPTGEEGQSESDEWPVHRRLIRAQLPRPEGHVPERKEPDFTFRPGGKFDQNRNNGGRHRGGHRPARHAHGGGQPSGQGQSRFGGHRGPGGGQGGPHGQRPGNRSGQGGGRPGQGQGQGRGPRPGGGRKRGR